MTTQHKISDTLITNKARNLENMHTLIGTDEKVTLTHSQKCHITTIMHLKQTPVPPNKMNLRVQEILALMPLK